MADPFERSAVNRAKPMLFCAWHSQSAGRAFQNSMVKGTLWSSVARISISIFLLFHIVAIALWCTPLDTPLIAEGKGFIRPYMVWSGLFQSWDTFAPSPKSVNAYVVASVITKDGVVHPWNFPRMEQLSFTERYYKERYRKFAENLQDDRNSALWPDVARHLARLYNNPANPPEIVMLIRYWSDITPPVNGAHHSERPSARIFFEYRVTPEDLK
jgi:hypothetical protein